MRRFLFAGLNVACARAISAAFLYCACRVIVNGHSLGRPAARARTMT